MANPKKPKDAEEDLKNLVKIDDHAKDIEGLSARLQKLEENLNSPDKFAKIFSDATKTQKEIEFILKETIKCLIKSDKEAIDILKSTQKEVNKEDWYFFLKKAGTIGWSIFLVVIGAIIQKYLR